MALSEDQKTAVGEAIGASPKPSKERREVRVELDNMGVYTPTGRRKIGWVLRHVKNEANRTPTGGRYTSRRITVRFKDDLRDWVGQFKKDEYKRVILHPLSSP